MGIPKVLVALRISGESRSVALVCPALRTRALASYVTLSGLIPAKLIFNSSLALSDLELGFRAHVGDRRRSGLTGTLSCPVAVLECQELLS